MARKGESEVGYQRRDEIENINFAVQGGKKQNALFSSLRNNETRWCGLD